MNAVDNAAPLAPALPLSEDRRMVAMEATWEIDALNDTMRNLCEDLGRAEPDQMELMMLRLFSPDPEQSFRTLENIQLARSFASKWLISRL